MASDRNESTSPQRGFRAKLTDAEGRIETTVAIMATDEAEALEQVRGLALSYTVELWEGGRLITTMPLRRR